MAEPKHEYVEFLLTMEKGDVVAVEEFGEGTQVEPVDFKIYFPAGQPVPSPLYQEHLQMRLKRNLMRALARK